MAREAQGLEVVSGSQSCHRREGSEGESLDERLLTSPVPFLP